MKIILITPALPRSRAGNRVTATRWKNILYELSHQVEVKTAFGGGRYDAMIALHAWRSAQSIRQFKEQSPDKPLIVALTGTDLYRFINSHPKPTLHSIKVATALVTLHDLAYLVVPEESRKKITVIYQSAQPVTRAKTSNKRHFDVCVVGHLREEKDPLRAAYAARSLPTSSRIRIKQFGKPHTPQWGERAQKEMQNNPRYHWYDEVPHWQIRRQYASADLMVLSSRMEGGANVISEACVARLPVIASNIDGSIGLLGKDYPGYYPVGNTKSLRKLLLKAEADASFLAKLQKACSVKAGRFTYPKEKSGWEKLLRRLG